MIAPDPPPVNPPRHPRRLPPHLLAALAALGLVALTLVGGEIAVRVELRRHMGLFAAPMSPAKLSGNTLETRAFETPGMLPIFGSSELNRPAANRPDEFFRRRPTGFAPFLIGRGGVTCLMITQKIAAVGSAARGKKVAVFLSASWFLRPQVSPRTAAGNLSPLQLGSWIFHDDLSPSLRQRIAHRLLDYPNALVKQPLLTAALRNLDQNSPASRLRLAALTPFGRAQNFLLERVETYTLLRETFNFEKRGFRDPADSPGGPGPRTVLDWSRLAQKAEEHMNANRTDDPDRASSAASEVGQLPTAGPVSNMSPTNDAEQLPPKPSTHKARGNKRHANKLRPLIEQEQDDEEDVAAPLATNRAVGRTIHRALDPDADFHAKLANSKEWNDLALLLATLKELGVDAVFINQPFNGVNRDQGGNTAQARREYYEKLHAIVDPTGFPLLDFSEHEEDKDFFNGSGHPSGKAWIYYDHALSDFYSHAAHG